VFLLVAFSDAVPDASVTIPAAGSVNVTESQPKTSGLASCRITSGGGSDDVWKSIPPACERLCAPFVRVEETAVAWVPRRQLCLSHGSPQSIRTLADT
jgi:hypothetical protein